MANSLKDIKYDKLTIVGFVISLVIVISYAIWYYSVVTEEVNDAARREMQEIGLQLELELEGIIEESEDDLSLLAEYVEIHDINYDNAVKFLNSQSQVEEFDSLYYVDLNGNGIDKDGNKRSFADSMAFIHALNSEFYVSDPHLFQDSGEFSFDVAVPVKKGDKVVAVLFSEASMEDFNEAMDSMTRGSGIAFLLDRYLNIVFTNNPGYLDAVVIPEEEIDLVGIENVKNAQNDITKGKSGSFVYEMNGLEKVIVYTPVKMTDWTLVISIGMDSLNNQLNIAVKHISYVSIIILFIFLGLVIYTWHSRTTLLRSAERNAYFDPLTGLPNLLKLKKEMGDRLARNAGGQYAILKFDIVNFKTVNEMFGFEIGNEVLKASTLIPSIAKEPALIMARIGVDEFVMFAEYEFLQNMEMQKSIYENIYNERIPELGNHKLSFKYGRYRIDPNEVDVDSIVNKVNLAHTMAKGNKGQIICDYDDLFKKQILREAELAGKMEVALQHSEFKVYLQPKFDLQDESLIGAEALVRWISADGAVTLPDEFISLFERNGFIVHLDRYILESVCKSIKKWMELGVAVKPISVNCSRVNLNNPNFVEDIVSVVDKYKVPHEYIDIELTESTMIENEEIIEKLFKDLHYYGFRISIDDFGSGYSSLGLLKNLKVDTLKLDKSFFSHNKDLVRSNKVVGGIIRLAHGLNIYVVAEGIETAEQVEILKLIRCDAVQGYHYARPMPISEFESRYGFKI